MDEVVSQVERWMGQGGWIMQVFLVIFGALLLDFFIYTFTKTTNWVHFHEIKEDVLLKVLQIIESNGAEVAFPTSTLHIPEGIVLGSEK